MSKRFVLVVIVALSGAVALGLAGAASPAAPAARAAASAAPPLSFTAAMSYTLRLPLILNCFSVRRTDPDFAYQWDMSKINADDAWFACGSSGKGATIAVIDTGADFTHDDLKPNLLSGYDFVYSDNFPEDGDGHGSNVAGIAAAALNGVGVAGVAPAASILPVRVLDENGSGWNTDIAAGIRYAADRAQVLNLSLGGPYADQVLQDAVNYAVNKGRLVVAAGGNCGSNYLNDQCNYTQNQPIYPGAFSNVMAVASTTSTDSHSTFSNVRDYIDIAAPGSSIYNAYLGNAYAFVSGTSQAAPHVAGLAALVWTRYPGYTAAQVWNRITATAVDLGTAGPDSTFGAGRIDVKAALAIPNALATTHAPDLRPAQDPIVDQRDAEIKPGRVVVKFKDATSAAAKLTLSAFEVERTPDGLDVTLLKVAVGREWSTIDQLRALPQVQYAEPDYRMWALR